MAGVHWSAQLANIIAQQQAGLQVKPSIGAMQQTQGMQFQPSQGVRPPMPAPPKPTGRQSSQPQRFPSETPTAPPQTLAGSLMIKEADRRTSNPSADALARRAMEKRALGVEGEYAKEQKELAVLEAAKQAAALEQANLDAQQRAYTQADILYQMALKTGHTPEQAKQIANFALQNPEYADSSMGKLQDTAKSLIEHSADVDETQRVEALTDKQNIEKSAGLAEFYMNEYVDSYGNPMDTKFASGLARNHVEPETGIKMWEEWEKAQRENKSAIHAENVKFRDIMYKADQTVDTVQEALGDVSPWSTGWGSVLSFLPATPAKDLEEAIKTLNATAGFKELFDMRQASKTGGALGNVSNKEIELLYRAFSSLGQRQSTERMRKNLNEVLERFQRVKILAAAESEGTLFGMSAADQEVLANEGISKLKHEAFVLDNPNTWREVMDGVRSGDISSKEFQKTFGFAPIPDNLPYEEEE